MLFYTINESKIMKIRNQQDTKLQINDANNEQISSLAWLTLNGERIENIVEVLKQNIEKWLKTFDKDKLKFIVSCDSQRHGGRIVYVTTIVFIRKGFGGQGYYVREFSSIPGYNECEHNTKEKHKLVQSTIQRRLWNECVKAVKCALWLDTILAKYDLHVEEIHEDINSNKKFKSNDMLKAIVGYIEAVGYKPVIKPDAWVASTIADSKTK